MHIQRSAFIPLAILFGLGAYSLFSEDKETKQLTNYEDIPYLMSLPFKIDTPFAPDDEKFIFYNRLNGFTKIEGNKPDNTSKKDVTFLEYKKTNNLYSNSYGNFNEFYSLEIHSGIIMGLKQTYHIINTKPGMCEYLKAKEMLKYKTLDWISLTTGQNVKYFSKLNNEITIELTGTELLKESTCTVENTVRRVKKTIKVSG